MIRVADQRWFSYILVRCADEERDEQLNVGVLVLDAASNVIIPRFEADLERVEWVLPNVPVAHLRSLMNSASAQVGRSVEEGAFDRMANAHSEWANLLRASEMRSVRGRDADSLADDLFQRYVEVPRHRRSAPRPETAPTPQLSSRRVVSSLRTRLRRAGVADADVSNNVRVTGFTRDRVPVPVWYPLRVGHGTYLEGLEIHGQPERDYDTGRLAALKVEQTLRSIPDTRIAVAIKDPGGSEAGEKVEQIIKGDGKVPMAVEPTIIRYEELGELDEWVDDFFAQRELLP